jgi:AraC family transcriptional regulator, transcriptional activator FtrA
VTSKNFHRPPPAAVRLALRSEAWQRAINAAPPGRTVAAATHVVAVLVTQNAPILELALISSVFDADHSAAIQRVGGIERWYEMRVCAVDAEAVRLASGFSIAASHGVTGLADADTVIVPADLQLPPATRRAVHGALRRAHKRGARLIAVRSGAFVFAAAGLLPEQRVTAHWALAEELRRRHPDVAADTSALYSDTDGIFTAAGGAATLDLCLELIRRDHGAAVANLLARNVLAAPHRAGTLPQSVQPLLPDSGTGLAGLLSWAMERLDQPLTLADLSKAANMTPRTLARRFESALGTSPLQWLRTQRIRVAQELLETTTDPIDRIAEVCGFGSERTMRHQFAQLTGVSPRQYRKARRSRKRRL